MKNRLSYLFLILLFYSIFPFLDFLLSHRVLGGASRNVFSRVLHALLFYRLAFNLRVSGEGLVSRLRLLLGGGLGSCRLGFRLRGIGDLVSTQDFNSSHRFLFVGELAVSLSELCLVVHFLELSDLVLGED